MRGRRETCFHSEFVGTCCLWSCQILLWKFKMWWHENGFEEEAMLEVPKILYEFLIIFFKDLTQSFFLKLPLLEDFTLFPLWPFFHKEVLYYFRSKIWFASIFKSSRDSAVLPDDSCHHFTMYSFKVALKILHILTNFFANSYFNSNNIYCVSNFVLKVTEDIVRLVILF